MKVIVKATAEAVAEYVHAIMVEHLQSMPATVLGLPTGSTPVPVYALLAQSVLNGLISWKQAKTFNLDEYVGLGADHPASYAAFMRRELFDLIDCPEGERHIPNGMAPDLAEEARKYEADIANAGGIDLMLLGLGRNAHIGFNEPGSDFASRTRQVDLTASTLAANAPFFSSGEVQPSTAISMGIGTILDARRIVVVATGAVKASAVQQTLEGPPDTRVPGSALQMASNVTMVIDAAAASQLSERFGGKLQP